MTSTQTLGAKLRSLAPNPEKRIKDITRALWSDIGIYLKAIAEKGLRDTTVRIIEDSGDWFMRLGEEPFSPSCANRLCQKYELGYIVESNGYQKYKFVNVDFEYFGSLVIEDECVYTPLDDSSFKISW